jgi:hypothetical protein
MSLYFLVAAAAALVFADMPAVAGCGMGGGHGGHGHASHHGAAHVSTRAAEARRQDAAASAWQDLRVGDLGRWDDWRGSYGGATAVDYTDQIDALAAMQRADEAQQCAAATIRTQACAKLLSEQAGAWPAPPPP